MSSAQRAPEDSTSENSVVRAGSEIPANGWGGQHLGEQLFNRTESGFGLGLDMCQGQDVVISTCPTHWQLQQMHGSQGRVNRHAPSLLRMEEGGSRAVSL